MIKLSAASAGPGAYRRLIVAALLLVGLSFTLTLNKDEPGTASPKVRPAFVEPQFEITWLRGELHLSGHTASKRHEQTLLRISAAATPERPVTTSFEPWGLVPGYWEDATRQVLTVLPHAASARATIHRGQIELAAVITDQAGWRQRIEILAATMSGALALSEKTLLVVAANDPAILCEDAVNAFKAGAIKFEESNAVFLASAYPQLDRITAIADACRSQIITIVGHTDASGSDILNQRLSLRRANVVVEYLTNAGIDRSRLRAIGAGASTPVASNKTRYGRGLNRRIEVGFEAY